MNRQPLFRRPRALGYLRWDLPGRDPGTDTEDLSLLARRKDYKLEAVLVDDDSGRAFERLLRLIADHEATAVIVPTLDHIRGKLATLLDHTDVWTTIPEQRWTRM